MSDKELLDLGFKDTSYEYEGAFFREFKLFSEFITVEVDGIDTVEICVNGNWIAVQNCKTIEDLKQLVKLFIL